MGLKDWAQKWHAAFYTVLLAKATHTAEHQVKGWGKVLSPQWEGLQSHKAMGRDTGGGEGRGPVISNTGTIVQRKGDITSGRRNGSKQTEMMMPITLSLLMP